MCSITHTVTGSDHHETRPNTWPRTVLSSPASVPNTCTMAAVEMLPSQVSVSSPPIQGPRPSVRTGWGRRCSMQILMKSDRNSIQLLIKNPIDTSGHTGENSARYPNWITISEMSSCTL